MSLREDIRHAINCSCAENTSNTPDFILAEFLTNCLNAYDIATQKREKWYGRNATSGSMPLEASGLVQGKEEDEFGVKDIRI